MTRIPLATDLKTRTGAPDKDARLTNCYVETRGDQSVVRKRAVAQGGVSVGTGVAQGGIGLTIDGVDYIYSVNGDVLTGTQLEKYATWNPLDSACILSNGNLTATSSGAWKSVRSTIGKSSGKWYWEITTNMTSDIQHFSGISNLSANLNYYPGGDANGWGYYHRDGYKYHGGYSGGYSGVAQNKTVGICLDMDAGTISIIGTGGVNYGVMYAGITGTVYASIGSPGVALLTANFGATKFLYNVPSGYNHGLFTEIF